MSVAWEKGEMKKWRKTSEIPFHLVHFEREARKRSQAGHEGKTPCIVAKTNSGFVMLATDEELTSFDGSVELLKDHIERQLTVNFQSIIPFTPEKIVEIAIKLVKQSWTSTRTLTTSKSHRKETNPH